MSEIAKGELILSANRALLGAISKNIKAITIEFVEPKIIFTVYFYQEPTKDEKEDMYVVTTEILADFPSIIKEFEHNFLIWNNDKKFGDIKSYLIYERKD